MHASLIECGEEPCRERGRHRPAGAAALDEHRHGDTVAERDEPRVGGRSPPLRPGASGRATCRAPRPLARVLPATDRRRAAAARASGVRDGGGSPARRGVCALRRSVPHGGSRSTSECGSGGRVQAQTTDNGGGTARRGARTWITPASCSSKWRRAARAGREPRFRLEAGDFPGTGHHDQAPDLALVGDHAFG